MRYKPVPEPRGVDALLAVRDAVLLVPGTVEDCCTRIRDRTGIASRDAAREWLTFCRARRAGRGRTVFARAELSGGR